MRHRFTSILALWTAFGLFNTAIVHYRSILWGKPMDWPSCAAYELSYAWIWALCTPAVLLLSRRFPIGHGQTRRNVMLHLLAAAVTSAITIVIFDLSALRLVEPKMVPVDMMTLVKSIARTLDFGMMQYAIIIVAHHAFEYRQRYEDGRLRASQLETKLATAQLLALKMQLHPHFLFNTLHSISELVHSDPVRAESMIVRLSDFLRLTLDHTGAPEVPLTQELDFLRRYLEIEQMRFEDRLTVDWVIDPDVRSALVPNLILQPLVENALKHGIAHYAGHGLLRIAASREDYRLVLRVYNNGPQAAAAPKLSEPMREGVGLNNMRSRMAHLYGGEHRIELRRPMDGGFEVTLRLPLRVPGANRGLTFEAELPAAMPAGPYNV